MRITCPNCRSTYELADGALGATGRKVRCTQCGQVWHAKPGAAPEPEPESEAEERWAAQDAAASAQAEPSLDDWKSAIRGGDSAPAPRPGAGDHLSDEDFPSRPAGGKLTDDDLRHDEPSAAATSEAATGEEAPPPETDEVGAPPAPVPAERPRIKVAAKTRKKPPSAAHKLGARIASSLVVSLAAMIAVVTIGGALFARSAVVSMFPDLAGLYAMVGLHVNLRGLDFVDVRTYREIDEGAPVLVVQGDVLNVTGGTRPVPTLRFGLKSAAGREVYAWTMEPPKRVLEPAERLSFKSRLPAPPEAAADVQVRFVDRRAP